MPLLTIPTWHSWPQVLFSIVATVVVEEPEATCVIINSSVKFNNMKMSRSLQENKWPAKCQLESVNKHLSPTPAIAISHDGMDISKN